MNKKLSVKWIWIVVIIMGITKIALAGPVGPDSIITLNSSRVNGSAAATVSALAGNVTEMNIAGSSITQFWQGYFGNISGTIVLGTASGFNLYQWNSANPQGEIYATRNSSNINWSGVRCANDSELLDEDTWLGANVNNTDSANNTFSKFTHPPFYVGPVLQNNCHATGVNGSGNSPIFWETVLMDPGPDNNTNHDDKLIYTSVIEQDRLGFDQKTHDFQMIVGDAGSGAENFPSGNPTTYYFYVELS